MATEIMSIDEEVEHLMQFLSHPAGFDVGMGGILSIRPTDEGCPPTHWAVDWEATEGDLVFDFEKEFSSLREAVQFFVEKRRYMCNGLDFDAVYLGAENASVEIEIEIDLEMEIKNE